jgi:hypothetical protein
MGAPALERLATGLPDRIRVELGGLAGEFADPVARVLVNMLLLAIEALPRGGTISMSGAPEHDILLMVSGVQAAWPHGLALVLAEPLTAQMDDPRRVQAPLVAQLAHDAGMRLSLLLSASGQDACAAPLLLTAA